MTKEELKNRKKHWWFISAKGTECECGCEKRIEEVRKEVRKEERERIGKLFIKYGYGDKNFDQWHLKMMLQSTLNPMIKLLAQWSWLKYPKEKVSKT